MLFGARILTMSALVTASVLSLSSAYAADQDLPLKAKPAAVADAPFFFVNDNRLTYSYVPYAIDPGAYSFRPDGSINGKTAAQALIFTHFDVWAYGTNFYAGGIIMDDHNDPAAPCTNAGVIDIHQGNTQTSSPVQANCAGSREVIGSIRSTFGWNELFNTKMFKVGPLSNISFQIGADFETENILFANSNRQLNAGLQFAFDLPYKGFFNFSPLVNFQGGHQTPQQCGWSNTPLPNCRLDGNAYFQPTWRIETNYNLPLGFLPENMQFWMISGRLTVNGHKGPRGDKATNEPYATEWNAEPIRLTFDAGKALWGPKMTHWIDLWVAYRYWKNALGDDEQKASFVCIVGTPGSQSTNSCHMSSVATGITVKF